MKDRVRHWTAPHTRLSLGNQEIHVWQLALDQPQELIEHLRQWLSTEEQARASRYHFDHDRVRFIVGRGALRDILSRYAGITPGELQLEVGPHGKPRLAGEPGEQLRFNVSHSKGLRLCAVARGRELGVDIECIRAVTDQEQIARRFFSAQETAEWLALPVEQRHAASYYDPRPATPGKVMARWGGWLHQIDPFDLYFFCISPLKAGRMGR
jgi:4'-phosphopantetheinyl transferase